MPKLPRIFARVALKKGGGFALALLATLPCSVGTADADNEASELRGPLHEVELSMGAALTSDYIFRGITQTDHDPALQPYFEAAYGPIYAGVWASNVKFGGEDGLEGDLYLGLRHSLKDLSLDVGYVQYVYTDEIVPAYGELYAKAEYVASDLTVGASAYYSPDYVQLDDDSLYLEATGAFSLPHEFAISGAVGLQSFADSLGLEDYAVWNAGLSWTWKETITFDLRYHDTDLDDEDCEITSGFADACGARVVATVSMDGSLSQLLSSMPSTSD